jgi:hypothetical protein
MLGIRFLRGGGRGRGRKKRSGDKEIRKTPCP